MRAVLCEAWGDPSTLTLGEVESLPPQANEVRIAVHACGINFADTLMIQGLYQVKPPFPFSPGLEISGKILECGTEVSGLKPGDRVVGLCGHGGLAEEVNLAAEKVILIPDAMDFTVAAGFPVAYGTSHVALSHRARLQAGEVLLVHGAAGGVGLTACEIGQKLGATVIATASTAEKLAVAAEAGATHLINYSEEDFRTRVKELTAGQGADVIYDPVGGDVFDQSLRCINWEGRLLTIGFASGRIPTPSMGLILVKNISIVGLYWGAYADKDPSVTRNSLAELMRWYTEGTIKPHISHTFPLAQAAEALRMLMSRQSTGKVVVKVRA